MKSTLFLFLLLGIVCLLPKESLCSPLSEEEILNADDLDEDWSSGYTNKRKYRGDGDNQEGQSKEEEVDEEEEDDEDEEEEEGDAGDQTKTDVEVGSTASNAKEGDGNGDEEDEDEDDEEEEEEDDDDDYEEDQEEIDKSERNNAAVGVANVSYEEVTATDYVSAPTKSTSTVQETNRGMGDVNGLMHTYQSWLMTQPAGSPRSLASSSHPNPPGPGAVGGAGSLPIILPLVILPYDKETNRVNMPAKMQSQLPPCPQRPLTPSQLLPCPPPQPLYPAAHGYGQQSQVHAQPLPAATRSQYAQLYPAAAQMPQRYAQQPAAAAPMPQGYAQPPPAAAWRSQLYAQPPQGYNRPAVQSTPDPQDLQLLVVPVQ